MATEDNKILKYNHGEKSLKASLIIYLDWECLLKKEQSCENNPEKSYTDRKARRKPSGYSWNLICSFDATKNKHDFCKKRDYIENFCKDLKEVAAEIINYKENEMIQLTDKERSYEKQKSMPHIRNRVLYDKNEKNEFKLYQKTEIIVITLENFEEQLIVIAI